MFAFNPATEIVVEIAPGMQLILRTDQLSAEQIAKIRLQAAVAAAKLQAAGGIAPLDAVRL